MGVKDSTVRALAYKSGNRCAKPGCNNPLVEDATAFDPAAIVGQIAHIVSQSDNGPRADPTMPQEERDAYENLVPLCPIHHTIADRQENTYTVEELRAWKWQHEAQVEQQMETLATSITFLELELAADAVANAPVAGSVGFTLTDVREKMDKNALTERVSRDMAIGMLGADIVRDYVADRAAMDPGFPERLRGGFITEYERLWAQGLRGDDLFFALREFAGPSARNILRQTAGLATLVHLFRICEVFEP